jgi:predicted acylesterase/phospholipase RssA
MMSDEIKRENVLVLGGGGARGIYQVGVLKALIEHGYRWDTIAGVSVGSINAFFLSHYKKEDQLQAIQDLERLWKIEIKDAKAIYKNWSSIKLINYIIGFKKNGVFNTDPLRKLLHKHYDAQKLLTSNVNLILGAFSMTTGNYVSVVGNNVSNIVEWVMASSSFPFAFPPVELHGDLYTDGGIKDYVPVIDVLNFCNPKSIDIILTKPSNEDVPYKKPEQINNMIRFGVRTLEAFTDKKTSFDNIFHLCEVHDIELDLFEPKTRLSFMGQQIESLDFSSAKLNHLFDLGYNQTIEFLKKQKTESKLQENIIHGI